MVCAERQPRGLLKVAISDSGVQVQTTVHDISALPVPKKRNADYAGLCYRDGQLYALERAVGAVSQIDLTQNGVVEKEFWRYKQFEDRPDLRYKHRKYGHGEGLFLDDQFVYVVFDNNRDAREVAPNDNRPLLLILERP